MVWRKKIQKAVRAHAKVPSISKQRNSTTCVGATHTFLQLQKTMTFSGPKRRFMLACGFYHFQKNQARGYFMSVTQTMIKHPKQMKLCIRPFLTCLFYLLYRQSFISCNFSEGIQNSNLNKQWRGLILLWIYFQMPQMIITFSPEAPGIPCSPGSPLFPCQCIKPLNF